MSEASAEKGREKYSVAMRKMKNGGAVSGFSTPC